MTRNQVFKKYKTTIKNNNIFQCEFCNEYKDRLLKIGDWGHMFAKCTIICLDCFKELE